MSYYIEKLTKEQAAWAERHGISFSNSAQHRWSTFSKGGLHIDLVAQYGRRCASMDFRVARMPSAELDGPDMNDGEPVVVASFSSLREALRFLAGAS